jgi:hypothetical protein
MFRMLVHPPSGACDLFVELFHVLYCSGTMRVGVTLWFGWGGVVCGCRLTHYQCFSLHKDTTPPQPNHNVTPTHIVPEQYNPWNNSKNKSQAPEDGCINIRNLLIIKWGNKKASDIKLVSLYSSMGLLNEVGWNNPGLTTYGKWEMHNNFRSKYWRKKITSVS